MKSTINLCQKMEKFFDCRIVGSVKLFESKLITKDLLNDVDIIIKHDGSKYNNVDLREDKDFNKVNAFLEDNGFELKINKVSRGVYGSFKYSFVYTNKNYDLPIHLLGSITLKVENIAEIIKRKWVRKSKSDIAQLKYIINNL